MDAQMRPSSYLPHPSHVAFPWVQLLLETPQQSQIKHSDSWSGEFWQRMCISWRGPDYQFFLVFLTCRLHESLVLSCLVALVMSGYVNVFTVQGQSISVTKFRAKFLVQSEDRVGLGGLIDWSLIQMHIFQMVSSSTECF